MRENRRENQKKTIFRTRDVTRITKQILPIKKPRRIRCLRNYIQAPKNPPPRTTVPRKTSTPLAAKHEHRTTRRAQTTSPNAITPKNRRKNKLYRKNQCKA
jgi:hypothetical protein